MKITSKDYKKPESFWIGKRVSIIKEIKNGHSTFPVGEEMTINRKWKGFGLVSDKRKEDGCIRGISQVPIYDIELIDSQISEEKKQ